MLGACESVKTGEKGEAKADGVAMWVTTGDKSMLLQKTDGVTTGAPENAVVIELDTATSFQTMDGFGFSLTG